MRMVFDMKDTSQIPALAEPRFLAFSAKISLRPAMNRRVSITKAAQEYGK